jgi:integrase
LRARLTRSFVEGLQADPDPAKRLTVWDTELASFGLVVTPPGKRTAGVKSYIVQYRVGGRGTPVRRVVLGRHGLQYTDPKVARRDALKVIEARSEGLDPFVERRLQKELHQAATRADEEARQKAVRLTLPAITAEFLERYAKARQPRSWKNTARALSDPDVRSVLGDKRLDEITRDEVRQALERAKGRSRSAAIEAHKAFRKLFTWAVVEQIIPASAHPMMLMEPPAKGRMRQRVLSSAELREVWEAAGWIGYPFGALVQGIISTGGPRLRECAEATRGEIHLDRRVWIIPQERMKRDPDDGRGDHLVPLGDVAIEVFTSLREVPPPAAAGLRSKSQWPLFTSSGAAPISGFANAKRRLDAEIARARRTAGCGPMPHWTNHDLRRTAETALQALGIDSRIIDLLHDHRIPGVSKVSRHYQLWDFYPQKLEAIETWNRYLRGVLFDDERYRDLVEQVDFKLFVSR